MTTLLAQNCLFESKGQVGSGYKKIVIDGQEVGEMMFQSSRTLSSAVLVGVSDEDAEILFPMFMRCKMDDGIYIQDFVIYENDEAMVSRVLNSLKLTKRPILFHSLSQDEQLYQNLSFKKICPCYYGYGL